jgi:hypothetical protein
MSRASAWIGNHRGLLTPLLVGILLRVALMSAAYLLTGTKIMTQGDTASYLVPGNNLILHGSYTTAGLPEIDRTPGYPLFAALSGMLSDNVLTTVLAQIALSLFTLLLVDRIARKTFSNQQAGRIAAWLYAVEPVSIVYTARILPETLFTFLLLAVIERLVAFFRGGRLTTLAIAAILLASATYVRPISYYLVFLLAMALAVYQIKRNASWWKAPCILLIGTLPLIGLWQVRNKLETGYSGFSSIVEKNLYFYQSAEVSAEVEHIPLGEEQKHLGYPNETSYLVAHPEQRDWPPVKRLQYMKSQSLGILSAHPVLYLRTHITGVGIVAFTPCAADLLQLLGAFPSNASMPHRVVNEGIFTAIRRIVLSHPWQAAIMVVMEAFLLLLYRCAIRGSFYGQGNKAIVLTLIGIALYLLFISGGAQAVGRYRLPVMPELCILAAGALCVPRSKQKRSPLGSAIVSS